MKVAILTMFNGLNSTYSLVNVVSEHLTMLLNAGISVKLLVSEDCPEEERWGIFADDRVEWSKVTNRLDGRRMIWHDYSQPDGVMHDSFFAEVDAIAEDLIHKLADADVCMLHDIHYQGWHLVHNAAVRKAQEKLPGVRFIAFTHSAPVNRPPDVRYPFSCRYTAMPNTIYVYPTQSGIPALAKQYDIPEGKCRVVSNSLDLLRMVGDDVRAIHRRTDLLRPDILIVYPGRFTTGKRFDKVAALGGAIRKKTERTVKIIFCDFPCADTDAAAYKRVIRATGQVCGLTDADMVFTSELGYPEGFPRSGVMELFSLSNLFICPSYSESFGLTVLEAASRGNYLVLNEAVPALEELGKTLGAYFMRWDARNFGYDAKETYQPSEMAYLEKHALKIVDAMRDDSVLRAKALVRRKFTPDWIWYHQLQPLLE